MQVTPLTLADLAEVDWYQDEEVPAGDLDDIDLLLTEQGLHADLSGGAVQP